MVIKKRKPRTKSYDLGFDGAHINGNPITHDSPAIEKLDFRFKNKLCIGCGKKECQCKSKNNKRGLKT